MRPGDGGTDKKPADRAGGGRVRDPVIVTDSNKDGQD